MNAPDPWLAAVDAARAEDELLGAGDWHGYIADEDTPGAVVASHPMKGRYCLIRWKTPTIAVSTDSEEATIAAAKLIERALRGDGARRPHERRAHQLREQASAVGVDLVVRLTTVSRHPDVQPYLQVADIVIDQHGTIIKKRDERPGRRATNQELDKAVRVPGVEHV